MRTGKFIRSLCATFNAAMFTTFLKMLRQHRSRGTRMVLVLDNAQSHHAVLLKPLLRTYRAVRTLLFLHRFFATLDAVVTAVSAYFNPLENTQLSATEIMRHNLRRYV